MGLHPSSQWLIEAGMNMMELPKRVTWQSWIAENGWTPEKNEANPMPPYIKQIAAEALERLIVSLHEIPIDDPEQDEIDIQNDIMSAQMVRSSLVDTKYW